MDQLTPSLLMMSESHALAANSCLVQVEAWKQHDVDQLATTGRIS